MPLKTSVWSLRAFFSSFWISSEKSIRAPPESSFSSAILSSRARIGFSKSSAYLVLDTCAL
jgi:hypothetical protein